MKISKDTVVTLQYKVADANGKLIEESRDPMVYLHGGYENTLPKIEAALDGQEVGWQGVLALQPEDAFGQRDESLMRTIPKSEFPPGVKVGGQLEGRTDDGQPHVFHVVKIKGPQVILDGNHPLAGKALRFHLKVTGSPEGDRRARRQRRGNRAPACARRARPPPLSPATQPRPPSHGGLEPHTRQRSGAGGPAWRLHRRIRGLPARAV